MRICFDTILYRSYNLSINLFHEGKTMAALSEFRFLVLGCFNRPNMCVETGVVWIFVGLVMLGVVLGAIIAWFLPDWAKRLFYRMILSILFLLALSIVLVFVALLIEPSMSRGTIDHGVGVIMANAGLIGFMFAPLLTLIAVGFGLGVWGRRAISQIV